VLSQSIGDRAIERSIPCVTWNEEKGTIDWIKGVAPTPEDHETTLKVDFVTFGGDLATPLTREQMAESGFKDRKP
jgi:hypothetical protein